MAASSHYLNSIKKFERSFSLIKLQLGLRKYYGKFKAVCQLVPLSLGRVKGISAGKCKIPVVEW